MFLIIRKIYLSLYRTHVKFNTFIAMFLIIKRIILFLISNSRYLMDLDRNIINGWLKFSQKN